MKHSVGTPTPARFGGIILAGGRSSRMGRAKAWLPVGGRTMLEMVVERVAQGLRAAGEASPPIVIVGAPGQVLPALSRGILRTDDPIEGEGPLRGMAEGFAALAGRAEAVYVSSCDVPLLRPRFVARMCALLGDADIAVPFAEERHHPLAATYRLKLRDVVRELLDAGERRLTSVFDKAATRRVVAADLADVDPDLESLKNFNTPREYAALMDRIAAGNAGKVS